MCKAQKLIMILVGLFIPTFAYAHALSPLHYPLAQYPVVMMSDFWAFMLVPLANIFVEVLVLWLLIRVHGFFGNLWRGVLLYIASQAVHNVILMYLCPLWGWENAGWTFVSETLISLALSLIAGICVACLLGLIFYKKTAISKLRCFSAIGIALFAGYLAAYVTGVVVLIFYVGLESLKYGVSIW